jgi:hypothetical protein
MSRRPICLALAAIAVALASAGQARGGLRGATAPYLFTPQACAAAPFTDVSAGHPLCAWIRQLALDEVSAGCGAGKYCPEAPVTRAQMAMLLERAMRGTDSWEPWRGMFARTLIVNPMPNYDPSANGDRLYDLLTGIADASSSKTYLVWVEPGIYDIGNRKLPIPSYVTVQGAGRELVEIRASTSGYMVTLPTGSALRSLSLRNNVAAINTSGVDVASGQLQDVYVKVYGGTGVGVAVRTVHDISNIYAEASSDGMTIGIEVASGFVTLSGVTAKAFSGENNYGIRVNSTGGDVVIEHSTVQAFLGTLRNFALYVPNVGDQASLLLRDVTVRAGSTSALVVGLYATEGPVIVEDSHLEAENDGYGVACTGASAPMRIEVHNSRVIGAGATVYAADADCTVRLGGSQLKGAAVDDGGGLGTIDCVALYGDGFNSPGINSCF